MSTSQEQFQRDCKTGDIVLCSGTRWFSYIIEWFLNSPISHVGFVYRDARSNEIFILESIFNTGVVLTPINEFFSRYKSGDYSAIYTRKLDVNRNQHFNDTIKHILKTVRNKKYDFVSQNRCQEQRDISPFDWIKFLKETVSNEIVTNEYQQTGEFVCSALVAFCFIKLGILDENIQWSTITPDLFSSKSNVLDFKQKLGSDILLQI